MKRPLVLAAALALLAAAAPMTASSGPSATRIVASANTVRADPLIVVDSVPPKQEPPAPAAAKTPGKAGPSDGALTVGSRGPQVQALEERLNSLTYMVGKVDGVFDRSTAHGLTAFQKVERLPRTGRGDAQTMARLSSASIPEPAYASPADHLEVDIPRQVVFVVRGGRVAHTLPTSTGSNKMFTSQGWSRRAITPNGRFRIFHKIPKMRISPLGELYKPSYFNGGIAFHGNGSVPTHPASHGCVRLPMAFADWFFASAAPMGSTVYVYGGPTGPNPQPVLDDKPASQPPPPPPPSPTPSPSPSPSPQPPLPQPSPQPSASPSPGP